MACQMGLRRFFADKRRCAVSDRMTLGAVLVTVFTLLVFDLVLRRPETSATFCPYSLRYSHRAPNGIRSDGGRCATQSARKKAPITAYFELFL